MQLEKSFLFDLNGTMIDDMQYHITAWHAILNELGAGLSLDQMKRECYGKNDEILERIFPGRFSEAEKIRMSIKKEKSYQYNFRSKLSLIAGLDNFLKQASANNIQMAIGSAAIMFNINFVLDGLQLSPYFSAIVSADDVQHSKPHPETWLACAARLNCAAANCIIFEDSPKGVEAASQAGMKAVVITTMHPPTDFEGLDNILFFIADYGDERLAGLLTQ
jgi:beta-phosphoglucomutase